MFTSRLLRMTIKYLRMMKAETDQLPLIIRGERDCLPVRTFVMVDETTEVEKNIDYGTVPRVPLKE
ncbi:TPA: hypothetical protein ACH5ZV_004511 [Escherichia coli]|uniref:hypothetical protein n=1 Tax=Enterobacteriaceae TaxID=543 RepID=UPI00050B781E|nr:hypothetical protein [Escherichia coli]EAX7418935.1 hypothetical protein [Salmonella enterica]ECT1060932.1 hypothetical protein [Salmonella enterica subsp. enterica serovar Kentucky]EFA4039751.1 hypothetical protein [Escherichia coli O120:H10]EFY3266813.1 hypothetical protein [Shigella sonnei]KJW98053.1 hypothetical protein RZ87_13725 [Enterobacter roggenkampii]CAE7646058.1 hypothetical protein AI2760V1_4734 [Enterobacter cloacae]HBR2648653.1 hypothetical protein [Klebsiella pneumoniae]H